MKTEWKQNGNKWKHHENRLKTIGTQNIYKIDTEGKPNEHRMDTDWKRNENRMKT